MGVYNQMSDAETNATRLILAYFLKKSKQVMEDMSSNLVRRLGIDILSTHAVIAICTCCTDSPTKQLQWSFIVHFLNLCPMKNSFYKKYAEPDKFASWEGSIKMNRPFRITDCCRGEIVTNHRQVCDVLADEHHAEVRFVCKRNFCLDYCAFIHSSYTVRMMQPI